MKLFLLSLLLSGCFVTKQSMEACKAACAPAGVKEVTQDKCECAK